MKGLSAIGSLWYAGPPPDDALNETILTSDGLPGPDHPERLATRRGLTPHERQAWEEITRS
ncbi:DUF6059 family protein [Streptacidiphilus sp. EB129]|uniref:DUF6059 family protein n=1 Tax=Streptacidiphilus sp. EB129 TaxID=3156262 RepID=UPI0035139365